MAQGDNALLAYRGERIKELKAANADLQAQLTEVRRELRSSRVDNLDTIAAALGVCELVAGWHHPQVGELRRQLKRGRAALAKDAWESQLGGEPGEEPSTDD